MRFVVLPVHSPVPSQSPETVFLTTDNWDDMFQYSTMFYVHYSDEESLVHEVGQVKIGQFKMANDQRRPLIPEEFDELGEEFFSLGQDESYYEALNNLGDVVRDKLLQGLRDIALDEELFALAVREDVTQTSLLRFVAQATVSGQFRRMAKGGARLSEYSFSFSPSSKTEHSSESPSLTFKVLPESVPPTNIHVLIGRNGVGKTHLLNQMSRVLVDDEEGSHGSFNPRRDGTAEGPFASLVSVTFSAFDPFEPLTRSTDQTHRIRYTYVGLKRVRKPEHKDKPLAPKGPTALAQEFGTSVRICLQGARQRRWRRALEMLQADPIFNDAGVANLADERLDDEELRVRARELYRNLSSGHKIVLLTITRLVESVEERSLVLLDEPEAHLHPPLLSAFIRALSDLLVNRNGVAIIATHSPVVLQEVPRSCAWILRRSGRAMTWERPSVETFGENVGSLTREVFGLEVTQSGFHRFLAEAVAGGASYEGTLARFDGQLGGEAKAVVQGLIAARDIGDGMND